MLAPLMTLSSHTLSEITSFGTAWSKTLSGKIIAALLMTGIHFYRGFLVLTPRIASLISEGGHSEQVGRLQRLLLSLVKTNFIFGIAVLHLAGILYVYRG